MVMNPKAVKNFAQALMLRTKTDAADAALLAESKYSSNPFHTKPTQPLHLRGRKKICCFFMESDRSRNRQENPL